MHTGQIIDIRRRVVFIIKQVCNSNYIFLAEVVSGHGWSRDEHVPIDYVSKYTNTYWKVTSLDPYTMVSDNNYNIY